jgi:hypothetical protein
MSEKGFEVKTTGAAPPVEKTGEPDTENLQENQGVIALVALATVGAIFLLKRINEKKEVAAQQAAMMAAQEEAERQEAFWSGGGSDNNTGVKAVPAGSSGNRSGSPLPGRE